MKEVMKYSNCFVCGDKNKSGLQAKFFFDGKQAFTKLNTSSNFEGYAGIYHGGIISTLLDEVMIKAILALDKYVVTAELTIKYLKPLPTDMEVTFIGRISRNRGKIYFTEGQVRDQKGYIYATAMGKYIEANDKLKAQLMKSTE